MHHRTIRQEPHAGPAGARSRGFSLIEVLIAGFILVLAATAGAAYVGRAAQQADWCGDRLFANQRALSILAELRGYVEGSEGEVAADLDRFDDGSEQNPALTIVTLPNNPDKLVAPDHPVSGNVSQGGVWRWWRQVTIRPQKDSDSRDRRLCTVKIYRRHVEEAAPGTLMASVSGLVQSVNDAFPCSQVYDLYVLTIDNCPGWWVPVDGIRSFVDGAISDLETKIPGAEFRVHYITKLGFGRDDEYAPYTNEERISTDPTPWTYVYPGRLPDVIDPVDGDLDQERYYDGGGFGARINLDGTAAPTFLHGYALPEPYADSNGNGRYDPEEDFTDQDGDDTWDQGNVVPFALADMHNHCMRAPKEAERFAARVAAGLESDDTPTWRLLLDRMVADPARYHNALLLNMHGELLPMPPVRNYSDAAKDPEAHPGWRAVTHPERLRPARVQGNALLSQAPRFRVYAFKTQFPSAAALTTQAEAYVDTDGDGAYDVGEAYEDWNGNGARDADVPITLAIAGGNFSSNPNGAVAPSILVRRLSGGIDSDGSGSAEEYVDWASAPVYPERFTDSNGNARHEVAEPFFDVNGDGVRASFEPWQELDGNGVHTLASEPLRDQNANGRLDLDRPREAFADSNLNGTWDPAEPYWDYDGNGAWTAPTAPKTPWIPWLLTNYGNVSATRNYLKWYGEPFQDKNGNLVRNGAETLVDANRNGVWDGGFRRGEMWAKVTYDGAANRTVVSLFGTPLEAPTSAGNRGVAPEYRLYSLDYVPCPTPSLALAADRFDRNLYTAGTFPKNTARWTVELPLASVRKAFESAVGANDGDAEDRVVSVETRFGTDLSTGVQWPVRRAPANASSAYAYFYGDPSKIPFSERYQFLGDPRHCPYADLDAQGSTFPSGHNPYFDDFRSAGNEQGRWLAFDATRLKQRWMGRCSHDVPRLMQWLRTAVTQSEALFTSMTGFSFAFLSVGGDVGYDYEDSGLKVAMDGTPFGTPGVVQENTFMDANFSVTGCIKYVRSNDGLNDKGLRQGGYWWSKPWIGELYPDNAYASQWKPWGNLRAAGGVNPLEYHLLKQESILTQQLPKGTKLLDARGELAEEGCVSFFMSGSKDLTFHHRRSDENGMTIADGIQLGQHYGFPMPVAVKIKHPFGLNWSGDGNEPPDFAQTAEFPHHTATYGPKFVAKSATDSKQGSAVVRLEVPGGAKAGRVVVTSIVPDTENGPAFLSRYQLITLLHTFLAEGNTGTPHRIVQLPRVEIREPTSLSDLEDPSSIAVTWRTKWQRWDGKPYTDAYASTFAQSESDLVYVLLYSEDNGDTWKNMRDDSPAEQGVLPLKKGLPDPAKTLADAVDGGDELFVWSTPATKLAEGSHVIRVEAFRRSESQHYAQHMEKIYVDR